MHVLTLRFFLCLLLVLAVAVGLDLTFTRTALVAGGATAHAGSGKTVSRRPRQPNLPPALREAIEKTRYKIKPRESAASSGPYQASNPATIDPLIATETHLFASDAESVIITEYPLSTPGIPNGIAAGPDGALWFTDFGTNGSGANGKIGRITTTGVITEYPLLTSNGGPQEITAGPDGALWFGEIIARKVGRITTAGLMTEFPTPAPFFGNPFGIATGPDGALWFCEFSVRTVGRITTSGVITEYTLPTPGGPFGITPGPDGALWFTEAIGKIGRITTAGTITEYLLPGPSSFPQGIVAGSDGALWFTEYDGDRIGRITISGVITEFPVPTSSSGPARITVGPDGALWFTEQLSSKIGRITTAGVITEYPLPRGSAPVGITLGPDGAVWFAEQGGKIGRAALNSPPVARCKNITVSANSSCQASITAADINDGSSDPEDGTNVTLSLDSTGPFGLGQHTVMLSVTDSQGASSSCQATVTVNDTRNPTVTFAVTRVRGREDDDKSFRITFSAADNCPGVTVSAVINLGCRRVPISNGQIVSVECDDDKCKAKVDRRGRLQIEARSAVLEVTATDASGNRTTKTQSLCRRSHDDDDH